MKKPRLAPRNIASWFGIWFFMLAGCVTSDNRPVPPPMAEEAVPFTPEHPTFEIQDPVSFFPKLFAQDLSKLSKSQFETEAEYEARIASYGQKSEKVFLEVQADQITYAYAAEKQTLMVMHQEADFGGLGSFDLTVARTTKILGKQAMQNAFGVVVDVTNESEKEYKLKVLNWRQVPMKLDHYDAFDFGMPIATPSSAAEKIVKTKSVTLIFGFTLGDLRLANQGSNVLEATIDSPTRTVWDTYEIPVFITDIKVYDKDAGFILASWTNPVPTVQSQ